VYYYKERLTNGPDGTNWATPSTVDQARLILAIVAVRVVVIVAATDG